MSSTRSVTSHVPSEPNVCVNVDAVLTSVLRTPSSMLHL